MTAFPSRYRELSLNDYPDLKGLRVRVNPTAAELTTLIDAYDTDDKRAAFGAALVLAYAGARVEAYGVVLDFSTAEKAVETITNEALPDDLRYTLRNAPVDFVIAEREIVSKRLQAA